MAKRETKGYFNKEIVLEIEAYCQNDDCGCEMTLTKDDFGMRSQSYTFECVNCETKTLVQVWHK